MIITTKDVDSITIVYLEGDLNASTANETGEKLKQLIMGGHKKLVVNLSKLNYVSSAGLRVFLSANKLIGRQNGAIHVAEMPKLIAEVFKISGFHLMFNLFETEELALAAF